MEGGGRSGRGIGGCGLFIALSRRLRSGEGRGEETGIDTP